MTVFVFIYCFELLQVNLQVNTHIGAEFTADHPSLLHLSKPADQELLSRSAMFVFLDATNDL